MIYTIMRVHPNSQQALAYPYNVANQLNPLQCTQVCVVTRRLYVFVSP